MDKQQNQPPQAPEQNTQPLYGTAARNAAQVRKVDPEVYRRHEESVKKYPRVALSSEEYIIEEVHRHPIGLVSIWLLVTILVVVVFGALSVYSVNLGNFMTFLTTASGADTLFRLPTGDQLFPFVALLALFFVLGGVIATIVYRGNEFFVTNEAIFQFVQKSLFDTRTQVVSLINVEDASQDQRGILQQLLNYGTLRVSTQGEETTYHFYFVANPARIVNIVNDCSEKAVLKMQGVPVSEH